MKKEIQAQTFTPVYDEQEDRIRLAVNYQDINNRIDIMITRSFILNLSPTADEFLTKHYSSGSIETTDEQNVDIEEKKSQSVSATDNANFELYRTSEELLTEVNFLYDKNTNNTLLTFRTKNHVVTAMLDEISVHKTFEVIKSSIPYIKWGIGHNF